MKLSRLLFFLPVFLFSKSTICLNMIVKNESHVIKRCLDSVKPLIDYWVIVDTGSTDGTQEIILEEMKGVPGALHERPWVDFAHNRNEALNFARGNADYIMIIDADEEVVVDPTFVMGDRNSDAYTTRCEIAGILYDRIQFIKSDVAWDWRGVLHEHLFCETAKSCEPLSGITRIAWPDGARSKDPKTYENDAELLEKALIDEPDNTRYQFYLGQAYGNGKEYEKAIKAFEKRAKGGGWIEEVFWSEYNVGRYKEELGQSKKSVEAAYLRAFAVCENRSEPIYMLADYYRKNDDRVHAYLLARIAAAMLLPKTQLFVEGWIYAYGATQLLAVCAFNLGRFEEALSCAYELLAREALPDDVRDKMHELITAAHFELYKQGKLPRKPLINLDLNLDHRF